MNRLLVDADRVRLKHKDVLANNIIHCLSKNHTNENVMSKSTYDEETVLDFMFYCPKLDDFIINRIVAYASREEIFSETGLSMYTHFAHVEISFPVSLSLQKFDTDQTMAFSITQDKLLFFRKKSWRNEYYKVSINVSTKKYKNLYMLCQHLGEQGISFDKYGMYAASVAPETMVMNRNRVKSGTFCSKIIMEVLQETGIGNERLRAVKPYRCTPSIIYKLLVEGGLF